MALSLRFWCFSPSGELRVSVLSVSAAFGVLVVLLVLSMLFSAAETAFCALNTLRLRYLYEKRHARARVAMRILRRKNFYLAAVVIGNTLASSALSAVIALFARALFGIHAVGWSIGAGTVLTLLFGEIIPKSLALCRPNAVALHTARFLQWSALMLTPFVQVFCMARSALLSLARVACHTPSLRVTDDDLHTVLYAGEADGTVTSRERALYQRILHSASLTARDIMTCRAQLIAVPRASSLAEAIACAQKMRVSRVPVYERSVDWIIGIFDVKKFLCSEEVDGRDLEECGTLMQHVSAPVFVFECTRLAYVQHKLRAHSRAVAIVLDEYGGTAGLVTKHNIYQAFFKSSAHEFPVNSTGPQVTRAGVRAYIFPGSLRLDEINDLLGTDFSSCTSETLAGLIMEYTGCIPDPGTTVVFGSWRCVVLQLHVRRIVRVRFEFQG